MAQRRHRVLKTLLVLAVVLVVMAGGYVGYVAFRSGRPVTLPAPTGAHPVGRTTVEWTDHSRADPLAPRPGTPRELSVWLWYPAAAPGASPAAYAPGPWAGLHLSGPIGLAETGFDQVHSHAFADVPVAPGRFPLAVLERASASPRRSTPRWRRTWRATDTWSPGSPPPTARISLS